MPVPEAPVDFSDVFQLGHLSITLAKTSYVSANVRNLKPARGREVLYLIPAQDRPGLTRLVAAAHIRLLGSAFGALRRPYTRNMTIPFSAGANCPRVNLSMQATLLILTK